MAQIVVDIGGYVFDAQNKTITFTGVEITDIKQIKVVINGTRGVAIFNPLTLGSFGTLFGNVLQLEYDTSVNQEDADELYICVNLGESEFKEVESLLLDNNIALKTLQNICESNEEIVKYLKKIYNSE